MKIFELPDYYDDGSVYLDEDAKLSSFGVVIFSVLMLLLSFADYLSSSTLGDFVKLAFMRLFMVLVSVPAFLYLRMSKEKKLYTVAVFAWWMIYVTCMVYIEFTRSLSYAGTIGLHAVVVITIYVIFNNRFRLQVLPASILSIASLLHFLTHRGERPWSEFYVLVLSFLTINVLGIYTSLILKKYRIKEAEMQRQEHRLTKKLEKFAFVDDLTGVFNRRKIMEVFDREFGRTNRYGSFLTVMMLDIDHFKHVNDKYGHDAGDCVLVEFARRVKDQVRETDFLGRFGGEEFLVIMPETGSVGAIVLAERIKKVLDEVPVCIGSSSIKVTASMGISQVLPDDGSKEISLKRADESLYMAKKAGRDAICSDMEVIVQRASEYYTP